MPSRFFAVFDDIAIIMDDVAAMSKYATKKTAGILADDLAVNAEKASGFSATREIPVLWKIAKGSFLNKLIILPLAFLLSAFLPGAIVPILLVGGLYLAYEGVEKIYEFLFHRGSKKKSNKLTDMSPEEALAYEKAKIKDAIIVDFILSVEIIIIALSTVADQPLNIQIPVVSVVAIIATIGVYGIVGLIVRMDDTGYKLIARSKKEGSPKMKFGQALVNTLPFVVRSLTVIGTLAMVLVAGGIYAHNIHFIHELIYGWPVLPAEFLVGMCVGIIAMILMKLFKAITGKKDSQKAQPEGSGDTVSN